MAVLAYALEEGGLKWGATGDNGTSFGPFQAHIGGANPYRDRTQASSWANSRKGLIQMMGMMSRTSAKGKKGRDAVKAIELEFGRGANPAETVRRAYSFLPQAQKVFGGLPAPLGVAPSRSSGGSQGAEVPVAPSGPIPVQIPHLDGFATPVSRAPKGLPPVGTTIGDIAQAEKIPAKVKTVRGGGLPALRVATDAAVGKPSGKASGIVELARHYLGTKYTFGGTSPGTGFDCSGFVQWLYAQRGISLPRTTFEQVGAGVAVSRDQLKPGDLVFFNTEDDPRGPSHEGLYIGNNQFLQAPHTGDHVKISSLSDPYYNSKYVTARRVL